jgi:site-specific recombinase XerD
MHRYSSSSPIVSFSIEWENGRVISVHSTSQEINHFLELIKTCRAYNTWVSYSHDLKVFFQIIYKQPEEVTRTDCVEFIKAQSFEGFADSTINRRLAAVSSLFNELCIYKPNQFPINPINPKTIRSNIRSNMALYRKQGHAIPKVFTTYEIEVFLDSLRTWRDRALVLLMWISCLRISEAVAICFDDLECSHRRIHIPVSKNQSARVVFMDQLTFSILNKYLEEERQLLFPHIEQVFIGFRGKARGKPLSINAVQKMIKYYGKKSGVSDVHAHKFRHTGITQLVQNGMSEPAIRKFVGHSSPDSLAPYLHLSDEFVSKEFEKAQTALQAYVGGNSP